MGCRGRLVRGRALGALTGAAALENETGEGGEGGQRVQAAVEAQAQLEAMLHVKFVTYSNRMRAVPADELGYLAGP